MRRRRFKTRKAVSASELAQMGVCERLVWFEDRYGKRSTPAQRAAMRRGLLEHDRFYCDGVKLSQKKGRCYIATVVFGCGSESTALRLFRDRVLRPYVLGRWMIGAYYSSAPAVSAALERWPWLQPPVRAILRPIVWITIIALSRSRGEHGL